MLHNLTNNTTTQQTTPHGHNTQLHYRQHTTLQHRPPRGVQTLNFSKCSSVNRLCKTVGNKLTCNRTPGDELVWW